MDEDKRLNPEIRELFYGKRELKKLIVYPLSVGDQFKVTNIITGVVQSLVEGQGLVQGKNLDFVFMSAVMSALQENLGRVLALVTDLTEEEVPEVLNQLTNIQFMDIVEAVWEVSYEPALKKGLSLFERGKAIMASRSASPSSSSSTPNTD
jgi:hypothetical protein